MEEEESKQIKNTINDLTVKINELSKSIEKTLGEKKEYAEGKIKRKSSCLCGRSIRWRSDRGLRYGQGKKLVQQSIIDFLSGLSKSIIQALPKRMVVLAIP